MADKKKPGRFTIQFNACDPQHKTVIDLLNSQGRNKAQFLAHAVLHYINCPEVPEVRQMVPDTALLEELVMGILEKHDRRSAPIEDTASRPKQREETAPVEREYELERWFGGKEGMASILSSLEMFQQT